MFYVYICYQHSMSISHMAVSGSGTYIYLVPELGHIVHDMVTDWISTGSTETIRETG